LGFNKKAFFFIYRKIYRMMGFTGGKDYARKTIRYLLPLLVAVFYLMSVFIPFFVFQQDIFGDGWLKVDAPEGELIWIDTSHWETRKVLINDGHWENAARQRWIDTSYVVRDGYYTTGQYRVWVEQVDLEPYAATRYVDTSHWETKYRYVDSFVPVNFTVISGTDSYGWSVYAFAAQSRGMQQVTYNGANYMAYVYVIDYRPARGGRIYATKYVFAYRLDKEKQYYNEYVRSGYWQTYTAYRYVDNSHWETRTGRYWVDTSYTVNSGYWQSYNERTWVDTSYYQDSQVWVNSGFYGQPLHGKISVKKDPPFVFTKWHKDSAGSQCSMELQISWQIDNSALEPGIKPAQFSRAYIYQELIRFSGRGTEKIIIFDKNTGPSQQGSINASAVFDYAGSSESILHIYLYTDDNRSVHAYFENPVNGYRSINLGSGGTSSGPEVWLGGNTYGEAEF